MKNRNPAKWNEDLIGIFPSSGADDVNEAVAAKAAFEMETCPGTRRGDILKVTGDKMLERKDDCL